MSHITVCVAVFGLRRVVGKQSMQQQNPGWPQIKAGEEFHRSWNKPIAESRDLAKQLTESCPKMLFQQQRTLVLGTSLGDGCLAWTGRHAAYRSNHGWKQAE